MLVKELTQRKTLDNRRITQMPHLLKIKILTLKNKKKPTTTAHQEMF